MTVLRIIFFQIYWDRRIFWWCFYPGVFENCDNCDKKMVKIKGIYPPQKRYNSYKWDLSVINRIYSLKKRSIFEKSPYEIQCVL